MNTVGGNLFGPDSKFDRYAGAWPVERFAAHGITDEPAELNRSEAVGVTLKWLDGTEIGEMMVSGDNTPALIDAQSVDGDESSSQ